MRWAKSEFYINCVTEFENRNLRYFEIMKVSLLNKGKIWVVSPVFYISSVALAVMACLSLPFSPVLFLINMSVALICAIAIYFNIKGFQHYIAHLVKKMMVALGNIDVDFLQRIPVPAVLVGKQDDIISYNNLFRDVVGDGRGKLGESIIKFLSGETPGNVLAKNGLEVVYNNRNYTVYGSQFDEAIALYFIECTEYKTIKQEYEDSKPVVAFVLFDNMEELKRDCTDGELSQLSSSVETLLREWVTETSGFIKKLSDGKYIILFEERHIRMFKSDKFRILNRIHSIKQDEHRWATISVGIGLGSDTMAESERWAQNALDMSLGRGGDQVSIKRGDSYEFFGGSTKEVEKRNKVRTRVIASALYEQMITSDTIFVMGHKFSDLDSVGAAVGVWNVASNMKNKKCYIVVDRDMTLAGYMINKFEKSYDKEIFISPEKAKSLIKENSLLIIVDTHSGSFVEDKEIYEKCKDVVVIDHHRMSVDHISNAGIFYHEPFASSTCEMVTELVQYMGDKNLKKAEAECLLSGIMLDTKGFFLKTGVRTFEAAAYLRKKGADTVEVKKMFSNSLDTYKIKCRIIDSADITGGCAVALVDEDWGDIRVACAQAADELLGIQGVKASFVLFYYDNKVAISSRSLGEINVQVIMEKLGGGGHQTMAAVQLESVSIEEAKTKLLGILQEIWAEARGKEV